MIGHSSGKSLGLPTITLSRLRFGITLVIVLMVISSPVVMLSNPVFAAPPSAATGDVTAYAPSTISQGGDFTAQAVLQNVRSVQSTDIVNSKAIYEILFTTATTGTIKTLEMVFPAGTGISGAGYIERTGIGPGSFIKSGNTITYTVTNPVSIPAGTPIRFELVNVQNPPTPNSNYQITITTRDPANAIIDGPTATSPTNIRQIGTGEIADNAVTTPKIANGAVTTPKIADQSVTVNKIQGFNKLIPGVCSGSLPSLGPGQFASFGCLVPESVQGEGIFATWCGVRVPPSPVLINAATQDGNVNFGFENPSSVATAAQPVVHACFLISNPPNGIS